MSNGNPKEVIIIAEDSAPNRKIQGHLLEKLGYRVLACEDGKEAWNHLSSGKVPNVVAVVSDIMMPNMDGIELLRKLREHDTLKDTPFILVTAVSDKNYIVEAKELNVTGYILKPLTFSRVASKLQEIFPNRRFPKIAV